MPQITFRVFGVPRPGGSKSGFYNKKLKRVMVVDSSKHIKTWKQDVKDAALQVAPDVPLDVPLEVKARFIMPRPQAHYRTGKHAGELKPGAPLAHIKKPDCLKLMRGTEDALTGIIYKDDSAIWSEIISKVYGDRPGAEITVQWGGE